MANLPDKVNPNAPTGTMRTINDFVFSFRFTCKQNHLRFSQVVLLFIRAVERLRADYLFCIS